MSTTNSISLLTAVLCSGLVFYLLQAVRRRASQVLEHSAEDAFSADRESFADYYRPMSRLLDNREMAAVRSLSHISVADFRRFRQGRIRAFQSYLDEMRFDFNRIEFKLRYMMLAATESEAQLVADLNRVKSRFQWELFRVRMQLLVFRLGGSTVNVEHLVELLAQFDASLLLRPSMVVVRR